MTPRQLEFCRHYLLGKPAYQAAIAAGYAHSTAERNAAAMLSHPAIQARIARLRGQQVFTRLDLAEAREQLRDLLSAGSDDRIRLAALSRLERLIRVEHLLPLNETPTESDKNPSQTPDNQPTKKSTEVPLLGAASSPRRGLPHEVARASAPGDDPDQNEGPEEFDALEDNTPAFDIRQSPRKPTPPRPEPIEIRVVDYLGGQEPEVHLG